MQTFVLQVLLVLKMQEALCVVMYDFLTFFFDTFLYVTKYKSANADLAKYYKHTFILFCYILSNNISRIKY